MIPGRIPNATRYLGAPVDWKPDTDGPCGYLAIKDQPSDTGLNYMISAWEPTPDELKRLNEGARVLLWIAGTSHPPVMVTAGSSPDAQP